MGQQPFAPVYENEIATVPPSDAELQALAEFELMIREVGETDARYAHTSLALDSLLAAQPESSWQNGPPLPRR
jgi:hypothetical protein